jgi:calcineurin-like phosphoesterase family protein
MMKLWNFLSQWLGNDRCAKLFGVRTFLTADLHFGHENILSHCPGRAKLWKTVKEMNAGLIQNWNDTIRPWDEVWVLGGVAMGQIKDTLPLVKQLQGHKYLVAGNHDRCSILNYYKDNEKNQAKRALWEQQYREVGFEKIFPGETFLFFDPEDGLDTTIEITLHHMPYHGDHGEERYPEARPVDIGNILLHGHVHDLWTMNGRQVNVGVDVWNFRPVRLETAVAVATLSTKCCCK